MQGGVKASVIINNYNYAMFIGEAIQSVLKQTYENWELIIVDDGSTDNSRDIILTYANDYPDKIKVVFKPNGGQGSALNEGYALAEGGIIAFLDSDDYWYPQKLERIMEEHKSNSMVGHNQKKEEEFGEASFDYLTCGEKNQKLLKEYGLIWFFNTTTSALSFTDTLLQKIFPIPEDTTRICADTYLSILGVYYSGMKYLDEKLGYYRLHRNNQYRKNKSAERKKDEILFRILQSANQRLMSENQMPIPYMNFFLMKDLHEKEENFEITEKNYVIYGTGAVAKRLTDYILFCGGQVFAYCDSNKEKWGTQIYGKKILALSELRENRGCFDQIVIGSTWVKEIRDNLEGQGFQYNTDYIYSGIGFWQ